MRLPSSSTLPVPTARTFPFCGFSLAVSGRTMPLAVVSSCSTARTIRRSPRGLSFMSKNLHLGLQLSARGRLPGRVRLIGTLEGRVPITASIYRRSGAGCPYVGSPARRLPSRASVLCAAEALHRLGHPSRLDEEPREAHDRHRVVHRDRPAIDLFEEVDEFLVAPELGVVVLDVAR